MAFQDKKTGLFKPTYKRQNAFALDYDSDEPTDGKEHCYEDYDFDEDDIIADNNDIVKLIEEIVKKRVAEELRLLKEEAAKKKRLSTSSMSIVDK